MTLVWETTVKNVGIFPSRHDGSQEHIEFDRIRGFDFRLPIEVKFDWYSPDKHWFVSTICIREYWTFESRLKRFNIRYVKCIELAQFLPHFVRMDLVWKIRSENRGIFPSHLDGSQKHIALGRIRGFDFRLAIEVKFDWYSFDKPCLVPTICIRE
jgi:hypothetical protein